MLKSLLHFIGTESDMESKKLQLIGLLAVVVLFTFIFARDFFDKPEKAQKTQASESWKLRPIGGTHISVLTPDGMRQIQIKLDEKAKEVISDYKAFEYKDKDFTMKINVISAVNDLNSEDYAKKLGGMIQASNMVDGYSFKTASIEEEGYSGTFLRGKGIKAGAAYHINSAIIVREDMLWEVTVGYKDSDKGLTENIFNSIEVR